MADLTDLSVRALLELHGDVLDELRRRKVVRSANGPAGDYGELLFQTAFGWCLEGNSAAGYDAKDGDDVRYQIKCRRLTRRNSSRQLGFMRKLPDRPFDVLAGVLLNERFEVLKAALVPIELVQQHAKPVAHVNAWRLILRDSVWAWPGVQDVTDRLKQAEARL